MQGSNMKSSLPKNEVWGISFHVNLSESALSPLLKCRKIHLLPVPYFWKSGLYTLGNTLWEAVKSQDKHSILLHNIKTTWIFGNKVWYFAK